MLEPKVVNEYNRQMRENYGIKVIKEYLDSSVENNYVLCDGHSSYKIYFEHNHILYITEKLRDEVANYVESFGWIMTKFHVNYNEDILSSSMSYVTIIIMPKEK